MVLLLADIGGSIKLRRHPWAIAPIDDGSDTALTAERLLLAAPSLQKVCLQTLSPCGSLAWRGKLAEAKRRDAVVQLRGSRMFAEVAPANSMAVSYCASPASSGFCIFGHDDDFLIVWTMQIEAFDDWLERTVPGCIVGVERKGLPRRRAVGEEPG